jgi:glycosyltransferase involved in cell wall biosynthesis/polysaccharide pyruvyl transferase WcaK-like protein/DNA-binding FrmR family transcriptional regulator
MKKRLIAHFGAFDHDSYGDVLFPHIVENALPEFDFVHVSPTGGRPPWSDARDCISVRQAVARDDWDGVLLGGGDIVQMSPWTTDNWIDGSPLSVAPMQGLWISASLLAARLNIPLAWNVPGVSEMPTGTEDDLASIALTAIDYLSVRDEISKRRLLDAFGLTNVFVATDSALHLPSMWPKRRRHDVSKLVISVTEFDASTRLDDIVVFIDSVRNRLDFGGHITLLPLMRWAEKNAEITPQLRRLFPDVKFLTPDTSIRECAETLANASAYVGNSMHGMITALVYGVPAMLIRPEGFEKVTKYEGFLRSVGLDPSLYLSNTWMESVNGLCQQHSQALPVARFNLAAHWGHVRKTMQNDCPPKKHLWQSALKIATRDAADVLSLGLRPKGINEETLRLAVEQRHRAESALSGIATTLARNANSESQATPVTTRCAIYFGVGADTVVFSEDYTASRSIHLDGRAHCLWFPLPKTSIPISALRFDPSERTCVIEVSRISIWSDSGKLLWIANSDTPLFESATSIKSQSSRSPWTLNCEGLDPHFTMRVPDEQLRLLNEHGGAIEVHCKGRLCEQSLGSMPNLVEKLTHRVEQVHEQIIAFQTTAERDRDTKDVLLSALKAHEAIAATRQELLRKEAYEKFELILANATELASTVEVGFSAFAAVGDAINSAQTKTLAQILQHIDLTLGKSDHRARETLDELMSTVQREFARSEANITRVLGGLSMAAGAQKTWGAQLSEVNAKVDALLVSNTQAEMLRAALESLRREQADRENTRLMAGDFARRAENLLSSIDSYLSPDPRGALVPLEIDEPALNHSDPAQRENDRILFSLHRTAAAIHRLRQQDDAERTSEARTREALHAKVVALESSLSWRMTKPFRSLVDVVREASNALTLRAYFRSPIGADQSPRETALTDTTTTLKSDRARDKVLVVSHDAHFAGAPILALTITRVLVQKFNYHVKVLLAGPGVLTAEFNATAPTASIALGADLGPLHQQIAQLRSEGFEKAICNTVVSGPVAKALQSHGFVVVTLVHELGATIEKLNLHASALDVAHGSNTVVFPGRLVRDDFARFATIDQKRQFVMHQGVLRQNAYRDDRASAKADFSKKFGLPINDVLILGAGYGDLRKGVDIFTSVARSLSSVANCTFVWMGDLEPRLASQLGLKIGDDKIIRPRFIGAQHSSEAYDAAIAAADLLLLPSREDPFPSVVIDALHGGTPVMAFASAGSFTEILSNENSVLVPYLDIEAMRDAVSAFCTDPHQRAALRVGARQLGDRLPQIDEYCATILRLFETETAKH